MTAASMFERRVHALLTGLGLLTVAVVLTIVVALDRTGSVLQAIDDDWLAWMIDVRTPWVTHVATVLNIVGGALVMVPVRLVVLGVLAWQRRWMQVAAFAGAMITSELCIGPLKAVIDRPRPPGSLISTASASFPSGHAVAASVTAIGLVIVLLPATSRRGRWTIVAAGFAALMAMSRTYLGAHWVSDVVAGVCIGTGLVLVWPAALELERQRRSCARAVQTGHVVRMVSLLRIAGLGLLGAGVACVVALHVLRSDLEPAGHRISEYAIGPYGSVMAVAFFAIGAALVALAWPLAAAGGRWSRAVAAAFAAAGVGMVISGIYPTDPGRSGPAADNAHSRASLVATLALLAAALVWSLVRPRPRWRLDVPSVLAVLAALLAAISPILHHSVITGISQRLLWLALLAWVVVTAWRLAPRSGQADRELTSSTADAGGAASRYARRP